MFQSSIRILFASQCKCVVYYGRFLLFRRRFVRHLTNRFARQLASFTRNYGQMVSQGSAWLMSETPEYDIYGHRNNEFRFSNYVMLKQSWK